MLCPASSPVPLVSRFTAQIILFDLSVPITIGATVRGKSCAFSDTGMCLNSSSHVQVELFHHSRNIPATISKLLETIDRASGKTIKLKPRVLTKNSSAKVEIALKANSQTFTSEESASGSSGGKGPVIPLETFASNKEMGRVLLRRGGETIGAGEWPSPGHFLILTKPADFTMRRLLRYRAGSVLLSVHTFVGETGVC